MRRNAIGNVVNASVSTTATMTDHPEEMVGVVEAGSVVVSADGNGETAIVTIPF